MQGDSKKIVNIVFIIAFSSVQSCLTLFNPMNHSTPGQFPESTQTHVHWVGDAIQPSYSLLSPSPPALNLSQQYKQSQLNEKNTVLYRGKK